ncbi:MAG: SAF domain-containing protein [Actinobacteria bacterium]|nr:SAF domain-containing protein [Actinomycetota bacterium]
MAEPMTDARAPRVRPRRDLRLIAIGVLAICLGGLGAMWLYSAVTDVASVIAVTRTVHRDQIIAAEDLDVIAVPAVPGLTTVSADLFDQVVGRTAHLDLAAGSLLTPRSYGEPIVEAGRSQLGLRLAPGRIPAGELPAGTEVLLVAVSRDGSEPPTGASVLARVSFTGPEQPDGSVLLDVDVPREHAEYVARLAAADQLVVVREPGSAR